MLPFLFFCSLYFIVAIKIDEWITISTLGFKSETPEKFLTNPALYKGLSIFLFLLSAVSIFFGGHVFIKMIILLLAWFCSGYIGHRKAYNRYRNVIKDMIAHSNTRKNRELERELEKSDQDLHDEVLQRVKLNV